MRGESPTDGGTSGISVQHPCIDLPVHLIKRSQGLGQALSGKDADFNLCHIQPGGVNGGIVDLQPLYDPPGLSRFKSFIQRRNRVNVQIVHNQHDFFTVTIMLIVTKVEKQQTERCQKRRSEVEYYGAVV